ncbi:hypothetical protein SBOR_3912 [Sclerotinia borealis F-4128]|uniref:Uncharacterized protein n=1 Tax=Sclerotinia borealis (strain F-4128) TaxID=1432307 RepID=W9CG10_SCLBF|nr:hypothetical protein SBOR_3912 [Sclerotinia borealis F-4128]
MPRIDVTNSIGYIIADEVLHLAYDGANDLIPSRIRRSRLFRRSRGSRSVSATETVIHNQSKGESSDSFRSEDPIYHQEKVDINNNSVSETETIIHNLPKEASLESTRSADPVYHQEKVHIFLEKENVTITQQSVSETETIIHNLPQEASLESIKSEDHVNHQEKIHISQKDSVAILQKLAEIETFIHNLSKEKSLEIVQSEDPINHQEKVDVFPEENVTTQKSVSKIETTTHNSSKEGFLEAAIFEDPVCHNIYQEKKFSNSQYSLSIYSQDGVDEVALTLKTKQINSLKALLYNKQLETERLLREADAFRLEKSQKSVSETETVIHSPLKGESSDSVMSEIPINEPKVKLSRRQRCRNKFYHVMSSTQEFIAPLKALHPKNRPEKGFTKQQAKEALDALENAPMFFKAVPFESTEEGEQPIFYGSKPVEEIAPPAPKNTEPERFSAEDYIGIVRELADDYLGVTGFNPRTGVLDSSEEHVLPVRRVRWASTEKGWNSKPVAETPIVAQKEKMPKIARADVTEKGWNSRPVTETPIVARRKKLLKIARANVTAEPHPLLKMLQLQDQVRKELRLKHEQELRDHILNGQPLKEQEPIFLGKGKLYPTPRSASGFTTRTPTRTTITGKENKSTLEQMVRSAFDGWEDSDEE